MNIREQSLSFSSLFKSHQLISALNSNIMSAATAIAVCVLASSANANSFGWTWIGGTDIPNLEVNYGQMGVPSEMNSPGRRNGSSTWTDTNGNLWLFGGHISAADTDESGTGNDVWMYSVQDGTWTWKKGKDFTRFVSVYGSRGVESEDIGPGTREFAASWVGNDGMVWVFGGLGFDKTGPTGRLNDLWRYNPVTNNWAWMGGSQTQGANGNYGTQGMPAVGVWPGSRSDASIWKDAEGDLWLFGGYGRAASGVTDGALGDLWKYDVSEGLWTWVKGSTQINSIPVTGTQGSPANDVTPGGLYSAIACLDGTGKIWLFGGAGRSISNPTASGILDDLWSYNPSTNQWTWLAGSSTHDVGAVYGTLGVPHEDSTPGSRLRALPWKDANGNLWIYGGSLSFLEGKETLADLWTFNAATALWSWEGGSQELNAVPAYGELGIPDATSNPGSRDSTVTWTDQNGNPWFYGGIPYLYDDVSAKWTDLWKFDIASQQWSWIDGSKASAPPPVFSGGVDVAPGARQEAVTWTTAAGTLWMFGGLGLDQNHEFGLLNGLWQYDTTNGEWSYISGTKEIDAPAVYGTMGTANSNNNPGSRRNATTWVDSAGNLWLFGGYAYRSIVPDYILRPDLWKYNAASNQWTWVNGGRFNRDAGVYGSIGVASPDNKPGAREGAASWVDNSGNFWMFGGYGCANSTSAGDLNDLWKYNPSTNQWTWMKGSDERNMTGTYGTKGASAPANTPGARHDSVCWTAPDGKFWLFGGEGRGTGFSGHLSDLWMYDPATNQWTWVTGPTDRNETPVYGTMLTEAPENTPGGKAFAGGWVDSNGDLWLYGGEGPSVDSNFTWSMSDVWKFNRTTSQWAWMGGSQFHDEIPVYGTKGEFDAITTPGARTNFAAWNTADGKFWILGGDASLIWNDLWVYGAGVVETAADDWQLFE